MKLNTKSTTRLTALVIILFVLTVVGWSLYLGSMIVASNEILSLKTENQSLKARIAKLSKEYNELITNYSKLKAEYATLQSNYTRIYSNYTKIAGEYNELIDEYSRLENEYSNLNSKYESLKRDFEELEKEFKILEKNYTSLNETYTSLLARLRELEEQEGFKIEILENREYYHSVRDAIEKANKTILVAMYSMIYDPEDPSDWANDLLKELVQARKRGIEVKVIIEYRTHWGYLKENVKAYDYLRANGVNVRLDDEADTDHMKFVVVDGRIVFVGSHNWSESALYHNNEVSVKIVSESIAKIFEEYFERI